MATLSRRARTRATREATEAALLAATIELLEQGIPYAELGVEQISRAAGFSRPTFYAYFDDKRDLVLRLALALQEDLASAADPWLTAEHGELRDTLAAVAQAFRRHRGAVRALAEAATYDSAVSELWRGMHLRFLPAARERILRSDPALDEEHATARAYALVWMTERVLTENLATSTVDEAALVDELACFWDGAVRSSSS